MNTRTILALTTAVVCAISVSLTTRSHLKFMDAFSDRMKRDKKDSAEDTVRIQPFDMPIKGGAFEILQPFYDMDDNLKETQLMAPPNEWVRTFQNRLAWVDPMVRHIEGNWTSPELHAVRLYIEMLKSLVTATAFNGAELSVHPRLRLNKLAVNSFSFKKRVDGDDWTYAGDTMIGWKRIDNIAALLADVIQNGIEGDYIETGVWRGGASVFAKGVLGVMEQNSTRISYVCDSFRGLPPGDKKLHKNDAGWDTTKYLEVPLEIVANNFMKFGLMDPNVVFAKGFFNETMPPLSRLIKKLSVMRLDGDMYESTVDVLYHMYDKLSVGGYVIMDDWTGFPSEDACRDFFKVHGINPEIKKIDEKGAYWQKTEDVSIQYWRYNQSKFT